MFRGSAPFAELTSGRIENATWPPRRSTAWCEIGVFNADPHPGD
jgi:hypothetical protein